MRRAPGSGSGKRAVGSMHAFVQAAGVRAPRRAGGAVAVRPRVLRVRRRPRAALAPAAGARARGGEDAQEKVVGGGGGVRERGGRASVWDVLALARGERRRLGVGILAALVSAAILLLTPAALGRVLDAVAAGAAARQALNRDALVLLGLYVIGASAKLVEVSQLRLAGERIVYTLRRDVFGQMVTSDVETIGQTSSGAMLSRLQSDSYDLQAVVTKDLPQMITGLLETVLGLAMLLHICTPLVVVVVPAIPLITLAAAWYGKKTAGYARNFSSALAKSSDVATEHLGGITVVKAFAREPLAETKYARALDDVLKFGNKVAIADGVLQAWNRLVFTVKTIAVLWLGGKYVTLGQLTVGGLFSFAIYTSNIVTSLGKFASGWGELIRSSGSVSRILEILRLQPQIEIPRDHARRDAPHDLAGVRGDIEFKNVSFTYPGRVHQPALTDVSLTISSGSSTALVARSGGGKSTVVSLLLRFHDPSAGDVYLDGRPLRSYNLQALRKGVVGIVPQDPVLFTGSIADNIRFGNADASDVELLRAAVDAGVMEFASRLQNGLDTVVGPAADGLSGGEKQRVMIARCLVKNPKILILDEATSALDGASEAMVNETIDRLMTGSRRTVIVISHRLGIAKRCDQIVAMQRGEVVEVGSHDALMSAPGGLYAELVASGNDTS